MRLTNKIRDEIVHNALEKSGLLKRQAGVEARLTAWVNTARIQSLGGDSAVRKLKNAEQKLKEILKPLKNVQCPSAIFPYENSLKVKIGGAYRVYSFESSRLCCGGVTLIGIETPLGKEWQDIMGALQDVKNEIKALRAEVRAVVGSVNTTNQLLKVWPGAESLVPTKPKTATPLPAVRVSDLNERIFG